MVSCVGRSGLHSIYSRLQCQYCLNRQSIARCNTMQGNNRRGNVHLALLRIHHQCFSTSTPSKSSAEGQGLNKFNQLFSKMKQQKRQTDGPPRHWGKYREEQGARSSFGSQKQNTGSSPQSGIHRRFDRPGRDPGRQGQGQNRSSYPPIQATVDQTPIVSSGSDLTFGGAPPPQPVPSSSSPSTTRPRPDNRNNGNLDIKRPAGFVEDYVSEADDAGNERKKRNDKKQPPGSKRVSYFSASEVPTKDSNSKYKNNQQNKSKIKKASKKRVQITVPQFVTVNSLASLLGLRLEQVQRTMDTFGYQHLSHNEVLDFSTVEIVADEYGFKAIQSDNTGVDLVPAPPSNDPSTLPPRPPIVTIMGHVDHGKTTILDYLRKSHVVDQEHGGITQHIGAFSVRMGNSPEDKVTFLDTPGHAAFLQMRQRGADVTDIVVLVVAAEDSIMPQTREAIKHAKAAEVPIIVAINKCDKPEANPERVMQDLAAAGLELEPYGGDIQVVQVSGLTGQGMDKLVEAIHTLAEINDYRAERDIRGEGNIIESQIKKGLGASATVLVRRGIIKTGSHLVAGTAFCKVRIMQDERGKSLKLAEPGTPVEITGWKTLPSAGDLVLEAPSESVAKDVVDNRIARIDAQKQAQQVSKLNEQRREHRAAHNEAKSLANRDSKGTQEKAISEEGEGEQEQQPQEEAENNEESDEPEKPIEALFLVKADVNGSVEAVVDSLNGLGNDKVRPSVVQAATGPPTLHDVDFAATTGASILTFNVKPEKEVRNKAAASHVDIVVHTIIYELIQDVQDRLVKLLPSVYKQKVIGEAEIRQIFEITFRKKTKIPIAGCRVINGSIFRSSKIRILRGEKIIFNGNLASLKQSSKMIKEVHKDSECGMQFQDMKIDFQQGDKVQAIEDVEVPQHL